MNIKITGVLSVIHINSRCLNRKSSKLKDYLSQFNNVSVVAVSEITIM